MDRIITPALLLAYLIVGVVVTAVTVYWLARGYSPDAFDGFLYAQYVLDGQHNILDAQPFLTTYFEVRQQVDPEFFAPLLHLSMVVPALLLLASFERGREILLPTMLALCLPEFVLFLAGTSKEGPAIAGVVWFAAAFAVYRAQPWLAAIPALIGALCFEFSRPYFSVVPLGTLAVAWFILAPRREKVIAALSALFIAPLAYWWFDRELLALYMTLEDVVSLHAEFLAWFEENMGSDSALKDVVRKALSLALLDIGGWSLLILGPLLLLAKAAIYTFAIPLIALPPTWQDNAGYVWSLIWQISASVSSVFIIAFVLTKLWPAVKSADRMERIFMLFAVGLSIAIAASTLIFHVRYRAPAELALLVVVFKHMPPSSYQVGAVGLAVLTNLAIALWFFMPRLW